MVGDITLCFLFHFYPRCSKGVQYGRGYLWCIKKIIVLLYLFSNFLISNITSNLINFSHLSPVLHSFAHTSFSLYTLFLQPNILYFGGPLFLIPPTLSRRISLFLSPKFSTPDYLKVTTIHSTQHTFTTPIALKWKKKSTDFQEKSAN